MRHYITYYILIVVSVVFSVSSFAQHPKVKLDFNKPHKLSCEFNEVVFHSYYDMGRISSCSQVDDTTFLIRSLPENVPINPSPWYGFSVESSNETEQQITVLIEADKTRPRYLPKLSEDKATWDSLPFSVEEERLKISLTIGGDQPIQYVSGQEIMDTAFYSFWNRQIASQSMFELETIGSSGQGRPIEALIHKSVDNKEWIYIIGRQHPPEVTGAKALVQFVETLIQDSPDNNRFFARFNVLLVPLLNPDGVAAGNWRHNLNGVDLNRDWGKFTQVETKTVHDSLINLMEDDHNLVFALDFHSTQQDIFYTVPTDYVPLVNKRRNIDKTIVPSKFVEEWLDELKQQTLRSFTVRQRPGSNPGRGVFKQFIADEYGVHAVTYEIGDNTDRHLIKHVATQSAHTLVDKLLQTPPSSFRVD